MPAESSTLALYLFATLLMCLAPGPNVMLMISLGLRDGSATVLRGVAGIGAASLVFLTVSAFGVAAALHASATLFAIVRYVGAAYLVYLGVRLLIAGLRNAPAMSPDAPSAESRDAQPPAPPDPATPSRGAFWQGFATHLSNPKAVLYWTALLPQFIDASRPIAAQTVTLGLIGIAIDMATLAAYGLAAAATHRLGVTQRYTRRIDVAAGTFFTITGLLLAFSHR